MNWGTPMTEKIEIKIKLGGTVSTSTGTLQTVKKPVEFVFENFNGPSWTAEIEPGAYLFICEVSGNPGPFGPVTVTGPDDKTITESEKGKIEDDRTGELEVMFTVDPPVEAKAQAEVAKAEVGAVPGANGGRS
jgi:hypothetical protein